MATQVEADLEEAVAEAATVVVEVTVAAAAEEAATTGVAAAAMVSWTAMYGPAVRTDSL